MVFFDDTDVISLDRMRARDQRATEPLILAVGQLGRWHSEGRGLPRSQQIAIADFHEVNAELLAALSPAFVVSPAMCGAFDCLDLAVVLQEAGFRGMYRALAGRLPNPGLIRREVRALCPDIDFDFLDSQMLKSARFN